MKYNNKPVRMTFKKLVGLIADIQTEEDRDEAYALIDWNFQQETISWADHETLYTLTGKIETKEA